ncbi:hypothetical protein CSPAE12_10555 [Colletotrichum incanum]|nr:hypothetical protein CSPAE12_10555 [Colletotrichum incanum]
MEIWTTKDRCCISLLRRKRIVRVDLVLLVAPRKFVRWSAWLQLSLAVVHRDRLRIGSDFFLEGLEGGDPAGAVSFERFQSPAILNRGSSKFYALTTLLG